MNEFEGKLWFYKITLNGGYPEHIAVAAENEETADKKAEVFAKKYHKSGGTAWACLSGLKVTKIKNYKNLKYNGYWRFI